MDLIEVDKVWGREVWIENDQIYCVKRLLLKEGFQSSLHFHRVKRETFTVVEGKVKLELLPYYSTHPDQHDVIQVRYLQPYQSITLRPLTPHRFRSVGGDAVIIETSSFHSDEDVVRLEDSRAVE